MPASKNIQETGTIPFQVEWYLFPQKQPVLWLWARRRHALKNWSMYMGEESCHVMYAFDKPDRYSVFQWKPKCSIPWLSKKAKRKIKLPQTQAQMWWLIESDPSYSISSLISHLMFSLHAQGLGEPTWKSFIDFPSNFKTCWSILPPSLLLRLLLYEMYPSINLENICLKGSIYSSNLIEIHRLRHVLIGKRFLEVLCPFLYYPISKIIMTKM